MMLKAGAVGFFLSAMLPITKWWFAPGALICVWLVLQLFELFSSFLATQKRAREKFDWKWSIIDKIVSWWLLVAAMALDVVTHLVPEIIQEVSVPFLSNSRFLPFTITALLMFITAEGWKLALNVKTIQGKDSDAWIVMKMFAFVNVINQLQWKLSGRAGTAPQRWTDRLDPEKINVLLEHIEKDSNMTPEELRTMLRESSNPEV